MKISIINGNNDEKKEIDSKKLVEDRIWNFRLLVFNKNKSDYRVNTGQDLGRRPNLQAFWEKFDPKPNLKRFFVSFFLKKRKGFVPCSSYHELTR